MGRSRRRRTAQNGGYDAFDGAEEEMNINKHSVHLQETTSTKSKRRRALERLAGGSGNTKNMKATERIMTVNKTVSGTTNTMLRAAAGNAGDPLLTHMDRKGSAVTMLSGYDHLDPKLEITAERVVDDRNTSLMSVSEFLCFLFFRSFQSGVISIRIPGRCGYLCVHVFLGILRCMPVVCNFPQGPGSRIEN